MNETILSNIAEGTHAGNLSRVLEAAVTTRYLLARTGSGTDGILVGTATDLPVGVITDEGAIGDVVNVALLGSAASTRLVVANGNIAAGRLIVASTAGKVVALPSAPGSYFVVGQAITAAANGGLVEFDPCVPYQRVVS
ncbi:MAG: hypothetical protein ACFB20_12730 [Opitutales bacterium]